MTDMMTDIATPADAWLKAAYDALVTQGVDAVKTGALADKLGVARSGLYWHFKNRKALLDALLLQWERKNTGNLVARTEAYADTITEAVFNLFDCWMDLDLFDSRLDRAVRNWALGNAQVTAKLRAADTARVAAIRAMFERFGYTPEQAEARAFTIYYTQMGYIAMIVIEPLEERVEKAATYVETFTGVSPSAADVARFKARHIS